MFCINKYTRWYFNIINNAKSQQRIKTSDHYYESHHIIPKCMGGIEQVLLTSKEHFICHLLLCRMTTGANKHKMINALIKMAYSKSNGQKRYTSKTFSLVRKLISEKNSEMFKGVPKSEKTKNNMKGRSGTWKRNDDYKRKCSERKKGKVVPWTLLSDDDPKKIQITKKLSEKMLGEKNPMTNIETKNKMKTSLRKKRWWTNGKEDVFSEICPVGFINGRTKHRKENRIGSSKKV